MFLGEEHGTRIEIDGLRHQWTRGEFRSVYKNILALNSPFKTDDSFAVNIITNHEEWKKNLTTYTELKEKALYKAHIVMENDRITEYKYEFCHGKY